MHIQFENGIFHLYNQNISYVIGILKNNHLGHYYFGKRLFGELREDMFRMDQKRGLSNYIEKDDMTFSLSHELLEFPCFGTTDYREPAIDLKLPSGSRIVDFKYITHRTYTGKKKIDLPATWGKEALNLEIDLYDDVAETLITLTYSLFEGINVIAKNVLIKNLGQGSITINRVMSSSIDLRDCHWDMVQFSGDWARERHEFVSKLRPGIQSIYSRRGASSAQHNPTAILKRTNTTEFAGEAIGLAFVYSGNFIIQSEVDSNQAVRLQCGIHPENFSWQLEHQMSFQAPEAILSYTSEGLNDLSKQFHNVFRDHLIQKKWQSYKKPVLLNNWEATYFDFTEDKLLDLASEACELGVELFVLDDGWFGVRNGDKTGLGDWFVNTDKLPNGLKFISNSIKSKGMQFGLWIEPEMVNENTQLISLHPDWVIGDPKRSKSHGRNQYVLDFTQTQVVDGIYNQLIKVLDDCPVDYIKWDMNRNITEAFSVHLTADQQGELHHRYILGVYDLYERLTQRYPHILFESCASGGARFDPAMLYFAPQAWTSDNTDAIERLKIQYSTSMFYPITSMGSHVSEVPNHQVGRMTSLRTRTQVAYFGTFGYELDITKLSDDDKLDIKKDITTFKQHRNLIHTGDFIRLQSPYFSNEVSWMVVDEKKSEALVGWYQVMAKPNQQPLILRLSGLGSNKKYKINDDQVYSGSYLMTHGLLLRQAFNGIEFSGDPAGDFQSRLFHLVEV